MLRLLWKVFRTEKTVIPTANFLDTSEPVVYGERLSRAIKNTLNGSLAIREVAAGSSNAEEQELTALSNPYYDIERYGIHFVASPRHADMLMVTGPISRNMVNAVKATYDAMAEPRIVVAVGDGAIHGGIYRGSYGIVDSLADVIPVDFEIPGDPPSPKTVIAALLTILEHPHAKENLRKGKGGEQSLTPQRLTK